MSSDGGKQDLLSTTKLCLLFQRSIEKDSGSQEFGFQQYMDGEPPIDTVGDTVRCVFIRWRSNDEVSQNIRWGTGSLKLEHKMAEERLGLKISRPTQGCLNSFRESDTIETFTKTYPCPLQRLYVNKCHNDCKFRLPEYYFASVNPSCRHQNTNMFYEELR